ncbi:adaptin N terminal region-domain-containing protein [Geranomyces variabilis]|nr:adaptin N terminal region-domain-containing protein [Geranomyces variabilis]KAJ3136626.1 AP-3 complex subunit beta-2 [Geranomyces variabilis]
MDKYLRSAATLASEAGKSAKRLTQELVERSKEVSAPEQFYDSSEAKLKEIRANLDSKFDKDKIDGVKRLVAMMSKGKNVKSFFPDVVKLVASNSFELRKLVYIYLLRYADQEPDLALLSINTFQKDLADRNPLIRAMALRVMSSIRVQVIVPIIMLALKKATTDLSPYVRKAAANAIPKCYSLDPSQQEYLIEIIEILLNDNSTLVLGSVISSMNKVCPNRLDLIHKHYRKLCRLLVEADEWSQIMILELLILYARTFFLRPPEEEAPNVAAAENSPFYPDERNGRDAKPDLDRAETLRNQIDPDHQLLCRSCAPLLSSRNPSVVLTVAKLYNHIGTASMCAAPAKALVRLLNCSREERYVVLLNIASMAQERPFLFKPFVRSFFIFGGEPSFIRDLKLEMLNLLSDDDNLPMILRELKDYVRSPDSELVLTTIKILGRLSCRIRTIAEESLSILMHLVSSRDERIVAGSVIVIRTLLQLTSVEQNTRVISQLSKSLDKITSPQAKASILWLIGQYCAAVPKLAPDTLRKAAKTFPTESEIVKLQILTLAAKLVCVDSRDVCRVLLRYVLELARYDASWDVRDRARFIKFLLLGSNDGGAGAGDPLGEGADHFLKSSLAKILLSTKATAVAESAYAGRIRYNLGSLSHLLNRALPQYKSLPAWPTEVSPEAAVLRDVEEIGERWNRDRVVSAPVTLLSGAAVKTKKRMVTLDQFYDDDDESDSAESSSSQGSEEEDEEEEEEEDEEEEDEEDDGDDSGSEGEDEDDNEGDQQQPLAANV